MAPIRAHAGRLALLFCVSLALVGCKTEAEKHYTKAKAHRDSGEFKEAVKEFEAVLALEPGHRKAAQRMGDLYRDELVDLDKALEAYKLIVKMDPQHYKGWEKVQGVYVRQGDLEGVIKTTADGMKSGAFDTMLDKKEEFLAKLELMRAELKAAKEAPTPPPGAAPEPAKGKEAGA